ncbi:MAG: DUF305 domain-containing protein [Verrucomicrobiales bacterium]
MKGKAYLKFGIMLALSFVSMYAVMFLNADRLEHVMLSYTRTYMTALMIAPMAVIMLGMMWSMYESKAANVAILALAVIVFVVCLVSLRNQVPIRDVQYMKAMIPHHSSAIMVSQEADLQDPETKRLAEEIIEAQEREIARMKKMLHRLEP